MQLKISPDLRHKLSEIRAMQLGQDRFSDEYLVANEVVYITYGLGPSIYLSLDGRVIYWDEHGMWLDYKDPRATSDMREIAGAIVIAADNLKLPELLDLLPSKPVSGHICGQCNGERRVLLGSPNLFIQYDGKTVPLKEEEVLDPDKWLVCPGCGGLGWQ